MSAAQRLHLRDSSPTSGPAFYQSDRKMIRETLLRNSESMSDKEAKEDKDI
jgi:hypothetical protein